MSFMRLTDHEAAIWAVSFIRHGADYRAVNAAAQAVADARRIAGELDRRQHEGVVAPEAAHMLREMVNRWDADRMDDEELGSALMWLDHRGHEQIADLLRAEYGIFWEDNRDYTNGSLGPAGLAAQLGIHCIGCGSQAVWLRSSDGRQWRCGNVGHIGFKFEVEGVEAQRAKEWYAKWLERKIERSSLYGRDSSPAGDEPLDDDLPDEDFLDDVVALIGQAGKGKSTPDDPLGLAGGPHDPGKFGR
jgi:hypothetical protein